ncbi:MAG: hypothetical protein ABL984_02210 [Pyrinomonadaceae bacterium]
MKMLIDYYLSDYDFNETHDIAINASPERVFSAVNEVDFSESFIVRWLLRLRGMSGENVTIRNLRSFRFETLGEIVDRELLIGLAGRFWLPWGDLQRVGPATFREFDKQGYAKAVWNFSVEAGSDSTRLTTETRIKCLGDGSRRSFGLYWMFVQPFSGWIRMEMLRSIKVRAEADNLVQNL